MFIQVVSVIPESCGNSNESVFVQVGGGVPPYSFSWSNGATTQNLSGIPGGTYTLSVTDDVGTPVSDQVVVPSIGGLSPYTYVWNTGATTMTITGWSSRSTTPPTTRRTAFDPISIEAQMRLRDVANASMPLEETRCQPGCAHRP